ncbi:hypothetical protein TNCV_224001 [Trichonephila clavipes]|nr:hypothetical protein TNCV_224001 [Trichonephila clavipes]
MAYPIKPRLFTQMVVIQMRVEQGMVYLVTLQGMMLKSASGIMTTVPSLDRCRGVLDHDLNSNKDSIWILTDSRSSIQYLKNWPRNLV